MLFPLRLKILIFNRRLKARTLLPRIKIPMSNDHRPGKPTMQIRNKLSERHALLWCSSISLCP